MEYINQCKFYNIKATAQVETEKDALVSMSRVSIMEIFLLESIVVSIRDHDNGVSQINKYLGAMHEEKSGFKMDTSDLHVALWHFVQRALNGLQL